MIASLHSVAQTVSDVWAILLPPVFAAYLVYLLVGMRRRKGRS